jgi:nucleotide-binding universal stress UspA family protein
MKTILLPTDYSETAKNAADYALGLSQQIGVSKIVFYNAYQAPLTVDPSLPVMQLLNMEEIQRISDEGMKSFKQQFSSNVEIETLTEFAVLHSNIDEICERVGADLIVMGITGGGGLESVIIGSNTISVVNHTNIPVLIVPARCKYKLVEEIVLVCDYKKINESVPQRPLQRILDETKAKLFVLNIDHNNKGYEPETSHETFALHTLLKNYNPEYQYVDSTDFAEATNDFVDKNNVDMIITIPRKHGFFESIFKKSHTKQLAYHTHVPLLCIHE